MSLGLTTHEKTQGFMPLTPTQHEKTLGVVPLAPTKHYKATRICASGAQELLILERVKLKISILWLPDGFWAAQGSIINDFRTI